MLPSRVLKAIVLGVIGLFMPPEVPGVRGRRFISISHFSSVNEEPGDSMSDCLDDFSFLGAGCAFVGMQDINARQR